MCSAQFSDVVLLIDITWEIISTDLVAFLRSANIPYVHVDVTIRPFVRAFFKFIKHTDTHDVAMIFQNEKGKLNKFFSANSSLVVPIDTKFSFHRTI